jgi:glycosyltransferase involved in cell wall biosynthesis
MKKVLYLSYDGMTDPLGQSQVIPYLEGLVKNGYQITLMSFEKKEKLAKLSTHIQSILDKSGIKWEPQLFTKRPPIISKMYDVWKLKRKVKELYRRERFDFIHCRSYVSAGAAIQMSRKHKIPFLFDMRGFWVDERVDNGQWDLSKPLYKYLYKSYKKKEKAYFSESSHIISLTWKGKEELINVYGVPAEKITVIPCCVDLVHFDYHKINVEAIAAKKLQLGLEPGNVVLTYLGSLGSWYMVKEMLDFFGEMHKAIPSARFLFVTQDPPASIYQLAEQSNVDRKNIIVQPALRSEVPLFLSVSDYCIFFIKNAYSKRASSPTKQGEIMAMGVPLICNDIGDTGKIIQDSGTGAMAADFTVPVYQDIINRLSFLTQLKKEDIRAAAFNYYDLQKGISEYSSVYKRILG